MIAIKDLVRCVRNHESKEMDVGFVTPKMERVPLVPKKQSSKEPLNTMIITAENILMDHNDSIE